MPLSVTIIGLDARKAAIWPGSSARQPSPKWSTGTVWKIKFFMVQSFASMAGAGNKKGPENRPLIVW